MRPKTHGLLLMLRNMPNWLKLVVYQQRISLFVVRYIQYKYCSYFVRKVPVYICGGMLLQLIDAGKDLGLSTEEFYRIFRTYFDPNFNLLSYLREPKSLANFERLTLILNNHGAQDGNFGSPNYAITRTVHLTL